MKKIILICLVLSTVSYAEITTPQIDEWSSLHFIGGFVFCELLGANTKAVFIAAWIGFMWEIYFDQFKNDFLGYKPDPRGPDFLGDAVLVGFGAWMAKRFKDARIRPYVGCKKVGVEIRLGKN